MLVGIEHCWPSKDVVSKACGLSSPTAHKGGDPTGLKQEGAEAPEAPLVPTRLPVSSQSSGDAEGEIIPLGMNMLCSAFVIQNNVVMK